MAGAKNRRQGAAAASPEPKELDNATGNGSAYVAKDVADGPHENIFLFWPNIIGTDRRGNGCP